jgi:glycolate oxidase subunit GlcD
VNPNERLQMLSRSLPSILTNKEDLFAYRYDASIDRQWPLAVFLPKDQNELKAGLKEILKLKFPITCRGAGTGLSGGAVPATNSIVVGTSRLRQILEIDIPNRIARVAPGVVNLKLSQAVARHGLSYAPDPSSQRICTIGGNVAENSGGPHCLKYGVTTHHLLGATILLPKNNEVAILGGYAIDSPAYDILALICGSEGTLAPIIDVTVKLSPQIKHQQTLLAVFDTVEAACQAVSKIIASGIIPAALEMIDRLTISAVEQVIKAGYPENAEAVLLIEVDGPPSSLAPQTRKIKEACKKLATEIRIAKDQKERTLLWRGRKEAIGALGKIAPNYYIQDGVLPRSALPNVLPAIKNIAEKYQLQIANVFHAGDGNLHPVILFDQKQEGTVSKVVAAGTEILSLCVQAGGSITGEHGIGLEKRHAFGLLFTLQDLNLFKSIKLAFDPHSLLNPDKIIPMPSSCLEGGRKPRTLGSQHSQPKALPLKTITPSAPEKQLQEQIKTAINDKQSLTITGLNSWTQNDSTPDKSTLSLNQAKTHFAAIKGYNPQDLTISVGCFLPLSDLKQTLDQNNQRLPLHSPFGTESIGGLLGIRTGGGHRRPGHGSARERLIALTFISGEGHIHKMGSRVAKNVAGYDIPRLLLGSRGTLALNLEASFQVIPKQSGQSRVITAELAAIERLCEALVQSPIPWTGLTVLNAEALPHLHPGKPGPWGLIVGYEGEPEALAAAMQAVEKLCKKEICEIESFEGEAHEDIWTRLDRLPGALRESHPIWRRLHTTETGSIDTLIKGVPRGTPATARRLCGIVDLFYEPTYNITRTITYPKGTWLRQLRPWRPSIECATLSSSVRDLTRGIKNAFDPHSIFPSIFGEKNHASN